MIRHVWSVLCSQTVTDAQTNNVSLFNVIEQLAVTIKDKPEGSVAFLPMPLEVMTLWERGEHEQEAMGKATVDVLDATGERLGGSDMVVDVSKAHRCRSRLLMNGIRITTSGRYVLRVALREDDDDHSRVVAEIPLEVTVTRLPAAEETEETRLNAPSSAAQTM
jgi:hypothetical protein